MLRYLTATQQQQRQYKPQKQASVPRLQPRKSGKQENTAAVCSKQHTNISHHHHQQQQHNSASFKNKENINLEAVPKFKTHDADAGSTQVQIARLTARIEQISTHLRANRKDFSSKRGLEQVLSQRKRLLKYLYRTDRASYDRLISELGIRSVIAGDSHKAAQREAAAAAAAN